MLSNKQQQEFVDWYKSLYGDTSKELPHIPASEEEKHIQMWKDFLTELIGPRKSKRAYVHKGGREDTVLGKVFDSLRFNYGPVIDDE